jgi:hypothetical protein
MNRLTVCPGLTVPIVHRSVQLVPSEVAVPQSGLDPGSAAGAVGTAATGSVKLITVCVAAPLLGSGVNRAPTKPSPPVVRLVGPKTVKPKADVPAVPAVARNVAAETAAAAAHSDPMA